MKTKGLYGNKRIKKGIRIKIFYLYFEFQTILKESRLNQIILILLILYKLTKDLTYMSILYLSL